MLRSLCPLHLNRRFESGEGDVLVRRIRRDAVFTGAEDGEHAVVAVNCGAARAGLTLVAGVRSVAEIDAASALQKVATSGRHVPQLG